ncbi:hypothetical protein LJK89_004675 [Vibrio parahaemolyticus]|nr:hypothetical protein [Vibrio parahaemolyticus]ELB2742243.1 hypothetical protein [Vibrio parahaemolyticus]
MSIIDKAVHKLTCVNCNVEETVSILDQGNQYHGSSWQTGAKFKNFQTKWKGGEKVEPELIEAFCIVCNRKPEHECHYEV